MLEQIISTALLRFEGNLDAALPRAAAQVRLHLKRVPTKTEHFFAPRNFPNFLLPWWFSPAREREGDLEFQNHVMYSSVSGYYAIRLCDNIADNDSPTEIRKLAPCTLYFDSEAIAPYRKYFPAAHAFWKSFDQFLAQQAEASAADSFLVDVDRETFASLSSRKFTGTKIPMSAVRWRYRIAEGAFQRWLQFIDRLGDFAQFNNDFFDWNHDSRHGITTYLSSESKRRAPGESIAIWFLREGFDWGVAELKSRFENVKLLAETLGNDAIQDWLTTRGRALEDDIEKLRSSLIVLKRLGSVMSGR